LPGLRPTSDRIRETLFNWLQGDILHARCLDLFAGSGALGLESLSRGAEEVIFVDSAPAAIGKIRQNLIALDEKKGQVVRDDALAFAARPSLAAFDIVFLDPPFATGLLEKSIKVLQHSMCLKTGTLIYLESEKQWDALLPECWQKHKEKRAGQVKYALFEVL